MKSGVTAPTAAHRILIIEEDGPTRELLADVLSEYGCQEDAFRSVVGEALDDLSPACLRPSIERPAWT